jgi:hypothetical protein
MIICCAYHGAIVKNAWYGESIARLSLYCKRYGNEWP